ncbi:hypothetical protein CY34DRAFT_808926 [Suillus luteus UH-Slu-Lm8-n1]|uniref:Uncharacterized protein n=1 Tax=Suillus luteus UH-Slu-Lm8-n1 TaxID=930992 RepID=A0A0D0AWV2_9AGAM|nr:hypothetical protein CY34DRAFT_808926 [Suillus luteus UH-Slu-Lm8-n1]
MEYQHRQGRKNINEEHKLRQKAVLARPRSLVRNISAVISYIGSAIGETQVCWFA